MKDLTQLQAMQKILSIKTQLKFSVVLNSELWFFNRTYEKRLTPVVKKGMFVNTITAYVIPDAPTWRELVENAKLKLAELEEVYNGNTKKSP
jgi:hypothetical protein